MLRPGKILWERSQKTQFQFKIIVKTQLNHNQKHFRPKNFLTQNFFQPKFCLTQNNSDQTFLPKKISDPNLFTQTNFLLKFLIQKNDDQNFFEPQKNFDPNFVLSKILEN